MRQDQKEFLKNYQPKDKFFTSWEEVDLIKEKLELEGMDADQLCEIRDEVVEYYEGLRDKLFDTDREKFYDMMESIQSVTAVIDHQKAAIGAFSRI